MFKKVIGTAYFQNFSDGFYLRWLTPPAEWLLGNLSVRIAPLPDWYSSSLFPFSHGDKMEVHMLTTHRRHFESGRLPSFLSNAVRVLCRAVF